MRAGKPDTYYNRFKSLQMALYAGPVFAFLSFVAYLLATLYIAEDKEKVNDLVRESIYTLLLY